MPKSGLKHRRIAPKTVEAPISPFFCPEKGRFDPEIPAEIPSKYFKICVAYLSSFDRFASL
jgi:hypothetical protein